MTSPRFPIDEETQRTIAWALRNAPSIAREIKGVVGRARELHESYKRLHWGDDGADTGVPFVGESTAADLGKGVVVLGELHAIEYLTFKGREQEASIYRHVFGNGGDLEPGEHLPILAVGPEGRRKGLVIVRGPSRYDVTTRGIVG